ncbi:hypothetical protein [Pseudodesulfovibrio senegalensis]|uniref:Conjugal transfer protein TraB n=1 Tax=Pseudodesulfovibrio senegalensis TaxID=1721087 RepID=A0A6N6N6H3_9BACT|nr:hypothetical protein [Pseudodesulfovibrio senegalensis]KAB1442717.1 hypothetical protein F8A88_00105 [Pseudodesulfovibrio senegalensis]
MEKIEKQALQVAKEVVIKFIEVGRISPSNFGEHFRTIYTDVLQATASGGKNNASTAPATAGDKE